MSTDEAYAADADVARPGTEEQPPAPPRRRGHALRRALIAFAVLVLVLSGLLAGAFFVLENRYAGNIKRVDNVFAGLSSRPAPPSSSSQPATAPPVTFLLMGSDTRALVSPGDVPGSRSDAIMIARFSADRQHAQLVSIPRDSWVDIPGHGMNKINAAYAFGGPTLLIQTVEQLTGVRIDHYVAIDFDGVITMTDALGGVDVQVARTTSWGGYTFPAGLDHLDGVQARWYIGQRYGLPGGDFDREKRQQQYLKAMFTKLFSANTFTDPTKLDPVLRAVTSSVAVDSGLSNTDILGLAYSLKYLRPNNVDFLTTPVMGTGREGDASVVYLDANRDARLWGYLKTDSLSQNAGEFSGDALPDVPN